MSDTSKGIYTPVSVSESSQVDSSRKTPIWKTAVAFTCLCALATLGLNVGVLVYVVLKREDSASLSSQAALKLFTCDCHDIETIDTLIHLGINIIGTILLSASNYCMQTLSAPIRDDIDKVHAAGGWLDVGVMSPRNLKRLSVRRVCLWSILAISSLPLHLLYNSSFFSSITANEYGVIFALDSFFDGVNPNPSNYSSYDTQFLLEVQSEVSTYERLDALECIDAYAKSFVSDRGNVVIPTTYTPKATWEDPKVVTDVLSVVYGHPTVYNMGTNWDPCFWICNHHGRIYECRAGDCCYNEVGDVREYPNDWSPSGWPASYCLSEKTNPTCAYYSNWVILVVVIACNLLKVSAMLSVLFITTKQPPLMTIGDAIQSFLHRAEPSTRERPFLSRAQVTRVGKSGFLARRAPSHARWSVFIALQVWTLSLITIAALLIKAAVANAQNTTPLLKYTFGSINGQTLITGCSLERIASVSKRLLSVILICNLPQVILSVLYLSFNGLLTSMHIALEWSNFAIHRKTLRVSSPRDLRRSTYFLQLPYRIGVLLMILSGSLHFLVSRSIFLVVVATEATDGSTSDPWHIVTAAYSPIAMLISIFMAALVIVAALVFGSRNLAKGMPVAASCSLAISAACHDPAFSVGDEKLPLQWGLLTGLGDEVAEERYAFSAREVKQLEDTTAATRRR